MSDVVEVGNWENEILNIKLTYIKVRNEFWFIGKESAGIFEYINTADVLKRHIFYDYKLTFKKFLDTLFLPEDRDEVKAKIKSAYYTLTHFWLQEKQILINELGFYQLATNSPSEYVEPFQRWVFTTIKEIRDKRYYRLPNLKNLSLEDKKETTEYLVEHDIPEFVFGGDNNKRKEIHDICKKGEEKSKDLVQSICGKVGGDKSAENTARAREFTKEVASKKIEDLNQMSQDDLYEYTKYLTLKSKDIVKEFKS